MTRDTPPRRLVTIRPRRTEDVAEAADALVKVHKVDGYPVEGVGEPEAWLTPPELLRAWVAEAEERIVGHVTVTRPDGEEAVKLWTAKAGVPETSVGVLARLFVVPDARGMAIGEKLVQATTAYARQHKLRLVLDVMTKDAAAIRLYERLGWERLGEATHSYGDGKQAAAVCYVSPP